MSGQHMSAPAAGNTLSSGPTIRTSSVMRSMCFHIARSCRSHWLHMYGPFLLLHQKCRRFMANQFWREPVNSSHGQLVTP